MAINPIDGPNSLDLTLREQPGGGARAPKRAPTGPVSVGAPAGSEAVEPISEEVQAPPPQPPAASMNLKISTDEETGKTIVSLVDPSNGKVLRQVPSDEALKVAEAIGRFQGMFVDLKV